MNKGFGVSSVSMERDVIRPRAITGNFNIFTTARGYVLIYFDRQNKQETMIFNDLDELLKFIKNKLISDKEKE